MKLLFFSTLTFPFIIIKNFSAIFPSDKIILLFVNVHFDTHFAISKYLVSRNVEKIFIFFKLFTVYY